MKERARVQKQKQNQNHAHAGSALSSNRISTSSAGHVDTFSDHNPNGMDTSAAYGLDVDLSKVCRCCLVESDTLKTLFCNQIVNGSIVAFPAVIESVTGSKVASYCIANDHAIIYRFYTGPARRWASGEAVRQLSTLVRRSVHTAAEVQGQSAADRRHHRRPVHRRRLQAGARRSICVRPIVCVPIIEHHRRETRPSHCRSQSELSQRRRTRQEQSVSAAQRGRRR